LGVGIGLFLETPLLVFIMLHVSFKLKFVYILQLILGDCLDIVRSISKAPVLVFFVILTLSCPTRRAKSVLMQK
jgi:hypothetical protein